MSFEGITQYITNLIEFRYITLINVVVTCVRIEIKSGARKSKNKQVICNEERIMAIINRKLLKAFI